MSILYTEWDIQLVNARTKKTVDDDSGLCNVLTAGAPTEVTIYSDNKGTSASNPLTMTDGIIRFYTASSTTTVDLTILTATGHSVFINALTPSQHRIEIDMDKSYENFLIFPYNMASGCSVAMAAGFSLLTSMVVKDVFVHTTTASTGASLAVGISGTPTAFLVSATVSATGFKIYNSPVYTSNTGGTLVSGVQVRGSLLCALGSGANTAADSGGQGWFCTKKYAVAAATALVFGVAATNSGETGAGYIYVQYDLLPTV